MNIQMEHRKTLVGINDFVYSLKKEYGINLNVINISSTPDGFDLFYNIM